MIPYAASSEGHSKEVQRALLIAQDLVDLFPEKIDGEWVRCHELARVVLEFLPNPDEWRVVDGRCGPVDHTWLLHRGFGAILDPYMPGALPQVALHHKHVVDRLYEELTARTDLRSAVLERLRIVTKERGGS